MAMAVSAAPVAGSNPAARIAQEAAGRTTRLLRSHFPLVTAALLAALAGCASPPPAPPVAAPASPEEVCRGLADSLAAAVPPGESLAELQARGIQLRTPLRFPPGTVPRPLQSSGAAVHLLIAPDGTVAAGSPKTVRSVGEPQLGVAMESAALSMTFDIDPGLKPAAPIPYTTTFFVCMRR